MRVVSWGRLQAYATCGLRLGAWYPVSALTAREAHVQLRGRLLIVPRSLLELRAAPPQAWTVVPPGVDSTRPLAGRRDGYVVCPSCRHREATPELRVPTLRCARLQRRVHRRVGRAIPAHAARPARGWRVGRGGGHGRIPRPPTPSTYLTLSGPPYDPTSCSDRSPRAPRASQRRAPRGAVSRHVSRAPLHSAASHPDPPNWWRTARRH